MRSQKPLILGILMGVLAAVAFGMVGAGALAVNDRHGLSEEFQRLVGGLGMGPAVDLSKCEFSFDPRICSECSNEFGPVVGGIHWCPQHACSVMYCPPLKTLANRLPIEVNDGHRP